MAQAGRDGSEYRSTSGIKGALKDKADERVKRGERQFRYVQARRWVCPAWSASVTPASYKIAEREWNDRLAIAVFRRYIS